MNELRLILLVAGLLFIAPVARFEWWRARPGRPLPAPAPDESDTNETPPPRRAGPGRVEHDRSARAAHGGFARHQRGARFASLRERQPASHRTRECLGIRHAARARNFDLGRSRRGCAEARAARAAPGAVDRR